MQIWKYVGKKRKKLVLNKFFTLDKVDVKMCEIEIKEEILPPDVEKEGSEAVGKFVLKNLE
jgi:hypothetical protein